MSLPLKTLASVKTPDGLLELRLRGEKDFLISIDRRILMSSSAHRSEVALAKLACAELGPRERARVLVSGLGMGFTLRAALDALPEDAAITVAELNPVIVEWCEGPLGPLVGHVTRDPRVTIEIADVSLRIAALARDTKAPKFDAIVLDMYEGPQTRVASGHPLYGAPAVLRTKHALTAKGVFAVWCEARSLGFERNLEAAGFQYRVERSGSAERTHSVYIASLASAKKHRR